MNDHTPSFANDRPTDEERAARNDSGEKISERQVRGRGWQFKAMVQQGQGLWQERKRLALRSRKKPADDWRQWSRFRLWRKTRPFWGSILVILAGLLVLWGPIEFLPFALLPGNSVWAGIFVGALLVVMGLIQLLAPSYALITGAIAIVLSLVSLLVAVGGLGIGMILGLIGGAIGVSWRPLSGSLYGPTYKRPTFTAQKASPVAGTPQTIPTIAAQQPRQNVIARGLRKVTIVRQNTRQDK